MGVMAGDTIQNSFLEPVSFIELELGKNITMTLYACCCRHLALQRTPVIAYRLLQRHQMGTLAAQNIVATCAGHT